MGLLFSQILLTLSEFWIGKWYIAVFNKFINRGMSFPLISFNFRLNEKETCEKLLIPINFNNVLSINSSRTVFNLNDNETEYSTDAQFNFSTTQSTIYETDISSYNLSNPTEDYKNIFCRENTLKFFFKSYSGNI